MSFSNSSRLPIAAVLIAIALAYLPLVTNQGVLITDDGFTSDIANAEWPGRVELGNLIRAGSPPLWSRNLYTGANFIAPGPGTDPLSLLFFTALPPVAAVNVYVITLLVIAGLGTVFFSRALGATPAGAAIAGIGFVFSGYIVCQLKHLTIICCIAYTPWALLALYRAFQPSASRTKHLAAFALICGLQWLAGFAQSAYIATLLYIGWGFTLIILNRAEKRALKDIIGFGLAGLTGVLIGTIQLFSALELTKLSSRSEGVSVEWATRFNYWLPNLWTFVVPYKNGDISDHTYVGHSIFWEDYSYTGLVTLLLAFGALTAFRTKAVRFFWVTALLAMLIVVGKNTPVFSLAFHLLPGMQFFRFPTRFLFVVHLALCVLAALGLTRLEALLATRDPTSGRLAPIITWVVVGLSFADLQYFQLRQNAIADADRWMAPMPSSTFLAERLGDSRAFSFLAKQTHGRASQAARGWADLEPYYQARDLLQPNANLIWGVAMPDGYMGLLTRETAFLWGSSQVASHVEGLVEGSLRDPALLPELSRVLRTFGVKYVLSPVPLALGEPIALGPIAGYELPNPAARFHLASRTQSVASDDEAFTVMRKADFEPEHDIVWVGPPEPASAMTDDSAATVTLTHETPLSSELEVTAPADVWLVNGESVYPRWVATVDGTPVDVRRANINQRAIRVPAGHHTVRFFFETGPFSKALAVTVLAFLAALALFIVGASKKGQTDSLPV